MFQGGEVGGREVRQVAVLGVPPDVFHRVEVRGVGRQPLDDDPPVPGQPGLDPRRPVGAASVPDEREAVRQVAVQRLEEVQDLGAPDVVWVLRPVQPEPAPAGRHGEGADRREAIPAIPLAEEGGLAAGRPRPAAHGLEHEAAFIEEDQAPTAAPGVFLYAASARPATAGWRPRPVPGPGAPASGSSTPPRAGSSRRGRGGR